MADFERLNEWRADEEEDRRIEAEVGGHEVVYRLIATVDDEEVFESEYYSSDMLIEDISKAENQVFNKLKELKEL